jgi:hypothetical protein
VRIAIWTMDGLIAAVVIAILCLVFAESRRLFLAVMMVLVVVGIIVMRYQFRYEWLFLGRYLVSIGIPVVMAWAGNYLAAKGETESERIWWRVLFGMLTAFALIGSFWLQSQQEKEHAAEVSNLRSGIKSDMTTALLDYNKEHPQHPVTNEQASEIIKSVFGKQNTGVDAKSQLVPLPAPMQLPAFGNLKSRALKMATYVDDEITKTRTLRNAAGGYTYPFTDANFRQCCLDQIKGITAELAQLHISDPRLDETLRYTAERQAGRLYVIHQNEMEEIAQRLQALAELIKN